MTYMDSQGNINCIAGDTFDLNLIDIKEDDVAIDFTDWKASLKIKLNANSRNSEIKFTETTGIDLSETGAIRILIAAGDMDLKTGSYIYDLIFTRPDHSIETWFNNKKFIVE